MNTYLAIWFAGAFISSQIHIMIIAREIVLDLKSFLATYLLCFFGWPIFLFCQLRTLYLLNKIDP